MRGGVQVHHEQCVPGEPAEGHCLRADPDRGKVREPVVIGSDVDAPGPGLADPRGRAEDGAPVGIGPVRLAESDDAVLQKHGVAPVGGERRERCPGGSVDEPVPGAEQATGQQDPAGNLRQAHNADAAAVSVLRAADVPSPHGGHRLFGSRFGQRRRRGLLVARAAGASGECRGHVAARLRERHRGVEVRRRPPCPIRVVQHGQVELDAGRGLVPRRLPLPGTDDKQEAVVGRGRFPPRSGVREDGLQAGAVGGDGAASSRTGRPRTSRRARGGRRSRWRRTLRRAAPRPPSPARPSPAPSGRSRTAAPAAA
jgi:hypothetical protein